MESAASPDRSMNQAEYRTPGGVCVRRTTLALPDTAAIDQLTTQLDSARGVLLTSDYEFPGRHRRWGIGFTNPPLAITSQGHDVRIESLNARGQVLLSAIAPHLGRLDTMLMREQSETLLKLTIREMGDGFAEEERSRQPSVFSVLRSLVGLFSSPADKHLGLYGAFGYDLVLQIERIEQHLPRDPGQRDMVLYLPDELTIIEPAAGRAVRYSYEFEIAGSSTRGLAREGAAIRYPGSVEGEPFRDHAPGEYAEAVRTAREAFRRGELFEVVLSQTFSRTCPAAPSTLFRRLRQRNDAPYAALLNLGGGEYLVSSSPAMYVRVTRRADGMWMESCPISGTISRGRDAMQDADAIVALQTSAKDTSELTMCTDVDRNDKSRVCEAGTVQVIGRRQTELYADVIHTVDHIIGRLQPDRDAVDAFLAHMWAVTVTGAPKLWAMRFIERQERTPRRWYGGAMGYLAFNGEMTTGVALRSLQIKDGMVLARAGATLLFDSDPEAEERESELKVGLFLDILEHEAMARARAPAMTGCEQTGRGKRILLIDHEDSFVHTLGGYFRQTGATVTTVRAPIPPDRLAREMDRLTPDLLVLSPGPGIPDDFDMRHSIDIAIDRGTPIFGVCLGLQGLVEHFGGKLEALPYPMHGKTARISVSGGGIFSGLPHSFDVGLYHSLHAPRAAMPADLEITAETHGIVMAVEHRTFPLAATQFHPESVMTTCDGAGLLLIANAVKHLTRQRFVEDSRTTLDGG
jgi:anthranilate synthase